MCGRAIGARHRRASRARADDRPATREHYRQGTKLLDLQRYGEAAREYEAALRIRGETIAQHYLALVHMACAFIAYRAATRRNGLRF